MSLELGAGAKETWVSVSTITSAATDAVAILILVERVPCPGRGRSTFQVAIFK